MSEVNDTAVVGQLELDALAKRAADQHGRLTGPPIPADFTYDRNGLRLGIAALEDELKELYDEWAAGKKNLDDPAVAAKLRHEALDIAAVAMLIYRNIPARSAGISLSESFRGAGEAWRQLPEWARPVYVPPETDPA